MSKSDRVYWASWLAVIGVAFLLGGIWTRWLLEDRLLQTGLVLLGASLAVWPKDTWNW